MRTTRLTRTAHPGLLLIGLIAAILLLPGCSEQPVSPNTPEAGLDGILWLEDNVNDPFDAGDEDSGSLAAGTLVLTGDEDEALVGSDGGTINVTLANGPATLLVPPRALNKPELITALAAQCETPSGTVTLFDFGPDGLRFKVPATLTVTVNADNGATVSLFYYNPKKDAWELEDQAVVQGNKVEFSISHFSKYGIS